MQEHELRYWLRLLTTPSVGRVAARLLLKEFGMPSEVFAQPQAALALVLTSRQVEAIASELPNLDALHIQTLRWLNESPTSRIIVPLGDPLYPSALLTIPDPPLLLFMQGRIDQLHTVWESCALRGIAVVGSRNPTPQGSDNARAFAHALAMNGCCIVSGMALGVDGAAHEGALQESNLPVSTIAVVGTGLDRVYPKSHFDLAHRIAESGLLVSEFPLGTPPHSSNFPLRNRIIAGLTRCTLVVEAAMQSGSLITAQQALEQGKDVLAIPGSIHSPQAKGCHWLIKQGAKLVESAQDILEELDMYQSVMPAVNSAIALELPDSPPLLAHLGYEATSIDELVLRSGWSTAKTQAALTEMELDGWVQRLPGGMYIRTGSPTG